MTSIYRTAIIIAILILMIVSCSSPTESEPQLADDFFDNFPGQLESDFGDQAILKSDGTLWVFGANTTGRIGNGTMIPTDTPQKIENLNSVVAVDFLVGGVAAADINGDIWVWGDRMTYSSDTVLTKPTKISHLTGVISIQMYGSYIRLLRVDGSVWQLLWDYRTPSKYVTPDKIEGMENICQISNSLALKNDGRICPFPNRITGIPEQNDLIQNLDNIDQIYEMYHRFVVILKNDHTVWAWGKNSSGTLGNGTTDDSNIPVMVQNIDQAKSISVDGSRCLALKNDGTVWFWGLITTNSKQGTIYQETPVRIENLENVKLIKAGGSDLSIVMKSDNTYWVFNPTNFEVQKVLFN